MISKFFARINQIVFFEPQSGTDLEYLYILPEKIAMFCGKIGILISAMGLDRKVIIDEFVLEYLNNINSNVLYFHEMVRERPAEILLQTALKNLKNGCTHYISSILDLFAEKRDIRIVRLGDIHCGGKCTLLIESQSERFIYKPINNGQILLVNQILSLLNYSEKFNFYLLNVISNAENHSVVEYIENSHCQDVINYSYHYGALALIITLLRGVDFHWENIFCVSSSPVIVDCETLFYPVIRDIKPFDVTATSLIPTAANSQSVMNKINLFSHAIQDGIEQAYQVFNRNRFELIEYIFNFTNRKTRVIFKPTQFYYDILQKSTYPGLLLNESKRREYIAQCLNGSRMISKIVREYEIQDLMDFNVPYFYCDGDRLFSSNDTEVRQNLIASSMPNIIKSFKELEALKNDIIDKVIKYEQRPKL